MSVKFAVFVSLAAVTSVLHAAVGLSELGVELAKDNTKLLQIQLTGEGSWTATTDAEWITLRRKSGTEKTLPYYTLTHNYSAEERTGVILVNGMTYTITQLGYDAILSPSAASVKAEGLTSAEFIAVDVEEAADGTAIGWTAASPVEWVVVTPASGSGDGNIAYRVLANEDTEARSAVLRIAGQDFIVEQEGASQGEDDDSKIRVWLDQTEMTLEPSAVEKSVEVTADADVFWEVVCEDAWINVFNRGPGKGSGVIGIAISENRSVLSRTGHVSVGGRILTIIQKGNKDFAISTAPESGSFGYAGGAQTIRVEANEDLPWTATCKDSWLMFPPGGTMEFNGVGMQDVRYQASLNTGLEERIGTIEIAAHIPYPEIDISRGLTLWRGENQNAGYAYDDKTIRDPEVAGETIGVWFTITSNLNSLHRLFDINGGTGSFYVTTDNRVVFDSPSGEIVDLKMPIELNATYDLFFASTTTNTIVYAGVHDCGKYYPVYESPVVLKITAFGHTTKPSEDWLVWGEASNVYYYWTRPLTATEMLNIPSSLPPMTCPSEACYTSVYNSFDFKGFRIWSSNKGTVGRVFVDAGAQYDGDRFGLRQSTMSGGVCYNGITRVGLYQDGYLVSTPKNYDSVVYNYDAPKYYNPITDLYGRPCYYRYTKFVGSLQDMRNTWSNLVEDASIYKSGVVTANLWMKIKTLARDVDLFEMLRVDNYLKNLDGLDLWGKISAKDKYKLKLLDSGFVLIENGVSSPVFGSEYIAKDEWLMLTLASNGSKLTLYVNGVDVGNVLLGGSYKLFCPDCWCCYGEGLVVFDDVKTFTSCLSTDQIKQIYELEKPLVYEHTVVQGAAIPQLSESEKAVDCTEGTYSVSLTLPNRIKWTVEPQVDWISVISDQSGTGSATVQLKVSKNPETFDREGTVLIAGVAYTIHQKGTGITLPETIFFAAMDGSDCVEIPIVTDDPETHWSVKVVENLQGDALFPEVNEGIGSGSLFVWVGECVQEAYSQIGIVEISGKRVYIVQRDFDLWLWPEENPSVSWHGCEGQIELLTEDSDFDAWQAVSDVDWVTLNGETSGSGDGFVSYVVAENTSGESRTGRIIVSGEVFEITQFARGVVSRLELVGNDSVLAGGSDSYQANLVYSTGAKELVEVVWSVAPTSLAQVSAEGVLTAGNSAGIVTLTASCELDGKTWTATRTIEILAKPQSLSVDTTNSVVYVNETIGLVCTVTYADGANEKVVPTKVSVTRGDGTVGQDGCLVVGNTVGEVVVAVEYTLNGVAVTAERTIDVRNGLAEIRISGSSTAVVGNFFPLRCMAFYRDGSSKSITPTWSVASGDSVATIGVRTGYVTAESVGTVVVAASYTEDNITKTASHAINVSKGLTAIDILGESELYAGDSCEYVCIATYSDGTSEKIIPTWELNAGSSVVTLSASGNLTAKEADGTAIVQASYIYAGTTKRDTKIVTVSLGPTIPAAVTGNADLRIPATWSKKFSRFATRYGTDLAAAMTKPTGKVDGTGKPLSVWHDYVMGTDPTNPEDLFRMTIEMVDGKPHVNWSPNLNAIGEERVYKVYGCENLGSGDWQSPPDALKHKFFKVDVAMPDGVSVTDVPGEVPEKWNYVAIPTAMTGLVYDGAEKWGVVSAIGYELSGNTATAAGSYSAIASLLPGYAWLGGSRDDCVIPWSIAKAGNAWVTVPSMSSTSILAGSAVTISKGTAKFGTVTANYTAEDIAALSAGSYSYVCSVPGTSNYSALTKSIAFTVVDAIKVALPKAKTGLVYTGDTQTGVTAADGYTVTGNTAINAGNYTATATLLDGCMWEDGTLGSKVIKWQIGIAQNNWTVVPRLGKRSYGRGEYPLVVEGVPAFGAVAANYMANEIALLAPGNYTYTVAVSETSNYTGLEVEIPIEITGAVSDPLYYVIDLSNGGYSVDHHDVFYMTEAPEGGWQDEFKKTKLVLRRIEPGTFMMGDVRLVTLSKPYYIGVFELTGMQNRLAGASGGGNSESVRPVVYRDWDFVKTQQEWASVLLKLSKRTGLSFDLPTEAQWEYACRAGTSTKYYNGGESYDDLKQLGRCSLNKNDGKGAIDGDLNIATTSVGLYQPNAWGLYDMYGNVSEWCLDYFEFSTQWKTATNPVGPLSDQGYGHVIRGGDCTSLYCSSTYREYGYGKKDRTDVYIGFRVVVNL